MNLAKFAGASFSGCHFERCDLQQANLQCRITDCTFLECNLDQAVLDSAIIERTHFEKSRLEYAVFSRATLLGGGVVDCQLHGAYLDMAESAGVDFSGSNLWGAVVPLGCAFIVGNKFDHRQVHMLLGLVSKAILDPKDQERLGLIGDRKIFKLVDRLVAEQGNDEQGEQEEVNDATA